ncbi:MAG: protein kinase, partial [Acidobacteriota bacterium]
MDQDRWRRLQGLFLDVLEAAPAERPSVLNRVDDPELRRELVEMLRAHEDDSQLQVESRILKVQRSADGGLEGQRIGAYEVRREVGRGGMGTVYLAERVEGYRQEVALKVMTSGPRSRELEDRFRRERQILARLGHPHIARILDGGMTDDGRPYLVMPFVEGRPITAHCDQADLGLRRRLELFCTVCGAVHHAHRNLIVHRDLKPSNILVTEDGGVKLLDFGIAKLLEPDTADPDLDAPDGATTRSELRWWTPEHAAPEQVLDQPITTATDTWALGVLLYELLAGTKPFSAVGGTRLELEVAICEQDPQSPSAAARQRGGGVGGEAWGRRLTGDLDTIVLHALRKAPDERYSSAEQLMEDVRRHLDGRPVRARPHTFRYRAGRFLRRNAWRTAAALTLAVALMGFAITSTLQARALQRERDAARLERDTAEQVTRVLVDLFETTDPAKLPGSRAMTVEDLLRHQAERVISGLEGQGVVQARMRHILGTVHQAHSRLEEGGALLLDAHRQQMALADWDDPATLAIYHDLAVHQARYGHRIHGQRMLRHSLDLHRAAFGEQHERIPAALQALAGSLAPGSEERSGLLEEALGRFRRLEPTPGLATAGALNDLGLARLEALRFDEALDLFRQSGDVVEGLLGADHPFALTIQANVSATLTQLNRFDEAVRLDRRLVDLSRELYGPESTRVANALNNLGTSLSAGGRWGEAEAALAESLALSRKLYGPRHPDLDNTVRNLAYLVEFQGRYADARGLLLGIAEDRADTDPRGTALTQTQLAGLLLRSGDTAAATGALEALVARLEGAEPPHDAALVSQPRRLLAEAYLVARRFDDAEILYRRLLDHLSGTYDGSHPLVAHASCGLASALAGQG